MPGKITSRGAAFFVFRFALIFAILIAPWPGWNKLYGQYFRGLGEIAFGSSEGKRAIVFDPDNTPTNPELDTRITLANRDLLDSKGRGLLIRTELDSRSIGWLPTALTIALILATPISFQRRGWALLGGIMLVHGFILFSLQSWIWNNLPEVSLLNLSAFGKQLTDELNYTLLNQIGVSFSVPVLIWVLVTFRRQDELFA